MSTLSSGSPDGTVSDDIAPELAKLVDNQTIRILDLVFLTKDTSGNVAVVEVDELDQLAGFVEIDAEVGGLIGPEDIGFVGEELDASSAAAVLLARSRGSSSRCLQVSALLHEKAGPGDALVPWTGFLE